MYSTVTTEQLTSLVGAAARLEAKCKLSVLYLFQGQKVSFQDTELTECNIRDCGQLAPMGLPGVYGYIHDIFVTGPSE